MSTERINLQNTPEREGVYSRNVNFNSNSVLLRGTLYLPQNVSRPLPAVIVTGAWTTVKEQMPGTYARELATRGFAAFAFDFTGWGESEGTQRFIENPSAKTIDIQSAASFLATQAEVDSTQISGVGICASSGYMAAAVADSDNLIGVALIAPWLHDPSMAESVYGGAEAVAGMIAASEADGAADNLLVGASATDEKSVMYQAPYYTEEDRGLIPEYDNKFSAASWKPWLTYDAQASADRLTKPLLLVGSPSIALPPGVEAYEARTRAPLKKLWLGEDVTQFDFYDRADAVNAAVDAVAEFFCGEGESVELLRIRTIIESVAALADAGNFESLEKLYADEVEVDYTSLFGGEIEVKSPQALMRQWASALPGFDCTKHDLSNHAARIEGDSAEATCDVQAIHLIATKSWTVRGRYTYRLTKTDGDWRIVSHKFDLAEETGSREVLDLAASAAAANPPSYLIRQQTVQAVQTFLESLEEKDMDRFAAVWADDAVQHMPFAPQGFPERVVGKEALLNHYAAWPENSGATDFTSELVFYPMADPEMIFAEFKGDVDVIPTQRKYEQSYGGLFHVHRGRITLFREYFNPIPFAYAFGLDEGGDFHSNTDS